MNKMEILSKVLAIPSILIGFTFHEFAHAWIADRLGDKTPRFQGRLTLNPFAHIDLIGFIMFFLVGIGWAKPVETNPSSFKKYYKDDLKVSIAGPLANLLVAFLGALPLALFYRIESSTNISPNVALVVYGILLSIITMNCGLFVLNLIPIPGFDGFHILRDLFPKFFYKISDSLYRYQFIIMIVFIIILGNIVVWIPARIISGFIIKLATVIG